VARDVQYGAPYVVLAQQVEERLTGCLLVDDGWFEQSAARGINFCDTATLFLR